MQNSEVENKERTFGRQTCQYSGVMRLCRRQANRVSVNLSGVLPWHGPWGGEERWQKRPLWATLWEMQHLHASEHKRSGGKRRGASHETNKFAALVPSLPMHRTESERAYILGPTRVRRKEDRPVLHATPLERQHSIISNDSMSSRY